MKIVCCYNKIFYAFIILLLARLERKTTTMSLCTQLASLIRQTGKRKGNLVSWEGATAATLFASYLQQQETLIHAGKNKN